MNTKLTNKKTIMDQLRDEGKVMQDKLACNPENKSYIEWVGYYWKQWFRK